MTRRCLVSPRAAIDLDDIWNYTAARWGLEQAETYARRLWRDIQDLATRPTTARPCFDVRDRYYCSRSGSHVIFFRLSGDDVDVVRILHERMDFERHL